MRSLSQPMTTKKEKQLPDLYRILMINYLQSRRSANYYDEHLQENCKSTVTQFVNQPRGKPLPIEKDSGSTLTQVVPQSRGETSTVIHITMHH